MKNKTLSSKKAKDLIFCLLLIAVPMVQFCIFYLGVNLNSFTMVFQKWVETDSVTGAGQYELVDSFFEPFKEAFSGFWVSLGYVG